MPIMKRMRGNPNWGKPFLPIPALVTEFENQVARLGLQAPEYAGSLELWHCAIATETASMFPNGCWPNGR